MFMGCICVLGCIYLIHIYGFMGYLYLMYLWVYTYIYGVYNLRCICRVQLLLTVPGAPSPFTASPPAARLLPSYFEATCLSPVQPRPLPPPSQPRVPLVPSKPARGWAPGDPSRPTGSHPVLAVGLSCWLLSPRWQLRGWPVAPSFGDCFWVSEGEFRLSGCTRTSC